jgi:type VI secretion system protein ImpM
MGEGRGGEVTGRFRPSLTGLFGKLPARGDFVRANLPEDFVERWDGWCRESLAASRDALGDAWLGAWLEAPVWRFLLPAGTCGAQAVLGVWLPSVDKVGRYFPLALCALAPSVMELAEGAAWLDGAEAAGLDGVINDAPHDMLAARLGLQVADAALPEEGTAMWWTSGGPQVRPQHRQVRGLPPASFAAAMLRDPILTES